MSDGDVCMARLASNEDQTVSLINHNHHDGDASDEFIRFSRTPGRQKLNRSLTRTAVNEASVLLSFQCCSKPTWTSPRIVFMGLLLLVVLVLLFLFTAGFKSTYLIESTPSVWYDDIEKYQNYRSKLILKPPTKTTFDKSRISFDRLFNDASSFDIQVYRIITTSVV